MSDHTWERPPNSRVPFDPNDAVVIKAVIDATGAKRILEFGPGMSTVAMLEMGVEHITSLEHIDKWFEAAKEQFKGNPKVTVLKFEDEMPITLELNEHFDMAFVDTPCGVGGRRKVHPGYVDTSRFNTCKFALDRCPVVLLHDAHRPLERGTLARLHALGYKFEILKSGYPATVKIFHENTFRPNLPRTPKPGGTSSRADPSSGRIPKRVRRSRQSGSGVKGA